MSRPRLALLTEIPAPYRIPLFNALSERVELDVLFLRERNPERPYRLHEDEIRFRWSVLPGRDATVRGRWLVLNRGVLGALRRRRPDAVLLGGWNQPAFWAAAAWAKARRVPVLAWVESTARDRRSGRLEPVKQRLLARLDGFVVPGAAAREYVRALGAADDRIVVAPNAVDPEVFSSVVRHEPRDRCTVLAVGRLAHEKGLDLLLDATRDGTVDVVIAGTGPEESRLRGRAGAHVRFLGHVERDELPRVYGDADVLVLPSRSEPWGMTLNEGALAGLPLVASSAAGAARELVEDGANGFVVPPDDVEALRAAIARLRDDPTLRARAGARSRELAARFTPEAWAEAVATLLSRLVGR